MHQREHVWGGGDGQLALGGSVQRVPFDFMRDGHRTIKRPAPDRSVACRRLRRSPAAPDLPEGVLAPNRNPTSVLSINGVSHLAFTQRSYRQCSINAINKVAP